MQCDSQSSENNVLYKIISEQQHLNSINADHLSLSNFDREFIHFAEHDDIERIACKFFSQEPHVYVYKIDPKKLTGTLRKEKNPGGHREYYHLYHGTIPKESIIAYSILKHI